MGNYAIINCSSAVAGGAVQVKGSLFLGEQGGKERFHLPVSSCASIGRTPIGFLLDWPAEAGAWFFAVVVGAPKHGDAGDTGSRFGTITVGRGGKRLAGKAGDGLPAIGVGTAAWDGRAARAPKRVPEGRLAWLGCGGGRVQEHQQSQDGEHSVHRMVSWIGQGGVGFSGAHHGGAWDGRRRLSHSQGWKLQVNRKRIKGAGVVRPRVVQEPQHRVGWVPRPAGWQRRTAAGLR